MWEVKKCNGTIYETEWQQLDQHPGRNSIRTLSGKTNDNTWIANRSHCTKQSQVPPMSVWHREGRAVLPLSARDPTAFLHVQVFNKWEDSSHVAVNFLQFTNLSIFIFFLNRGADSCRVDLSPMIRGLLLLFTFSRSFRNHPRPSEVYRPQVKYFPRHVYAS